jgi:hypothetical protein
MMNSNLPFAAQQEQVNKFLTATRALGAQMDQMQGTTRIIYDSFDFGLTNNFYSFFSAVSSKNSITETNINDNRFEPGEGMVIKEIVIASRDVTNGAEFDDTIQFSTLDVVIGNNRVVKGLPLLAGNGSFGINAMTGRPNLKIWSIRLLNNIVIPPQIQFFVNLQAPTVGAATPGNALNLRVFLKGYGKLFNPRNNY